VDLDTGALTKLAILISRVFDIDLDGLLLCSIPIPLPGPLRDGSRVRCSSPRTDDGGGKAPGGGKGPHANGTRCASGGVTYSDGPARPEDSGG
jgi:hypothetical protein